MNSKHRRNYKQSKRQTYINSSLVSLCYPSSHLTTLARGLQGHNYALSLQSSTHREQLNGACYQVK